MNKLVKINELFEDIPTYLEPLFNGCEYPWEILPKIKEYFKNLPQEILNNYKEIKEGVYVGKNVEIHPSVTIEGNAIIGDNCTLRTGAYLRGNVIIVSNSVVGNSSELKNCILLNKVQVPHYNYVGDSILGSYSHMGASSICSNLKSDGKNVVVHGDNEYQTGLRKMGAILGDHADIGCGCVLNPGCIIGKNTSVYPLLSLRGVYPKNCIVKSVNEVVERR